MKIIIGFSRARAWYKIGSKAIQLSENRNFSHCIIEFIEHDQNVVAQASHGMVNLVNKEIFLQDNIIAKEYTLNVTNEQYQEFIKFIYENLGKPYSTMQLLLLAIKKLAKFEIKSYNKDKYYICSEFAARICKSMGLSMPEELDYVTPSDLDKLLSEQVGL